MHKSFMRSPTEAPFYRSALFTFLVGYGIFYLVRDILNLIFY